MSSHYGEGRPLAPTSRGRATSRRSLTAWREAFPPPSYHWAHRASSLGAIDECLPALGGQALVEQMYTLTLAWTGVRVATTGRGLDHVRGALALRLDRLDEAEQHYRTGLEWTERERCPVEQGRCLEGLAEVASRRGQNAEAEQFFDRAAALFEQHGAVFYLRRLQARRADLTA